ncbi:HD domain-containing phosphohydrolase [Mangrovibacter plantisponsor]|uniref:Putative nucleotidyltransferase with HDIG domain n=1 Tax=Mangrovibacter plantisponsor TaxID=451513 RepID=A0A317Q1D4_9ENTR|nr:HD domain-containing phosphohydrolase [Mangrovibacter plantisponsor]PWW09171.1 putative nucleotidyltransferase with HDIG domain [Mangrovibacter plantisponsor]
MKISIQTVLDLLHSIIKPISPEIVIHLQRTALISWYLANKARLPEQEICEAYLAGMLHDIGALDKSRADLALASESFLDGHEASGAAMTAGIRFLQPVTQIIEHHHLEWMDGSPLNLPLIHHLVHMADSFELYLHRVDGNYIAQREEIVNGFLSGNKKWPLELVDALIKASQQDGFWFRLGNPEPERVLQTISPLHEEFLGREDFLEVCLLISKIVDKYSSFTQTHSTSVAHVAEKLSELYGYDTEMQQRICIAGYLHDIGKLFIPLSILEKHGRLEAVEYARMKLHSYKTLVMLEQFEELGRIVSWAANHHERLDGSGYPFGLVAAELDIPSRILAVADVFTATTENRPYRRGMDTEKAIAILMEESANGRLDRDIVGLLIHNIGVVKPLVAMC